MTEIPTCTCGSHEPKRIIFPCAGQANTGQISNLAALQLTEEGFGSIACVALLATGAEGLVTAARDADEVVLLDGCPMRCGGKIADSRDIPVARHLVITELGIIKGPSKSFTDDDVERVVSACWAGEGKKDTPGPPKAKTGTGGGCGCGCDGR
jgi:uncharacterized metal-binding protein